MNIFINNDSRDTTDKNVSVKIDSLNSNTTHIVFDGDIVLLKGDNISSFSSGEFLKRLSSANILNFSMLLSDDFGEKFISCIEIYKQMEPLKGGVSSVTAAPIEYHIKPESQALVSSSAIGASIYCNGNSAVIKDIKNVSGENVYVMDSNLVVLASDMYYIGFTIELSDRIYDVIKYIDKDDIGFVYPDADLDVSMYWDNIKSFYPDNIPDEDKKIIESIWKGATQNWGNLMQRLYEIDSMRSIETIFKDRRSSWGFLPATKRRYSETGYTKDGSPDRFFDDSGLFIPSVLNKGISDSDENRSLVVNGKAYEITSVISPGEISCADAHFEFGENISYSVGLEDYDDLSDDNKFDPIVSVVRKIAFKKEVNNYYSYKNVSRIGVANIVDGGRIGYLTTKDDEFFTNAAFPDTIFSTSKLFNHAHSGQTVLVGNVLSSIESFSKDKSNATVKNVHFLTSQSVNLKFINPSISEYKNGKSIAGSAVLDYAGTHEIFSSYDLGCSVYITSGLNVGQYKIVEVVNSKSIILNKPINSTDNAINFYITTDVIVNIKEKFIKRFDGSRIKSGSIFNINFYYVAKYRARIPSDITDIPTLQEVLINPYEKNKGYAEFIAKNDYYLGHKNISNVNIINQTGMSLMHGVDYEYDSVSGVIFNIKEDYIGNNFKTSFDFVPYKGRSDRDYFIRSGFVYFLTNPNVNLFAESMFFNNEDAYNSFGFLIDYYDQNTDEYLIKLSALWNAYWRGPRPDSKEIALNVLFGLPFAENRGVVTLVSHGIVGFDAIEKVSVYYEKEETEITYNIPKDMVSFVTAGESVDKFAILAGFKYDYFLSGNINQNTLTDIDNNDFKKDFVGAKIVIRSGDNEYLDKIVKYISPSRLELSNKYSNLQNASYTILIPGVRLFDTVNYPGFIKDKINILSLSKYFTENTTESEKLIAYNLLENHLFLIEASSSIYNNVNMNFKDILGFIKNIKGSYTDFIFQNIHENEDSFAVDEDNFGMNVSIDLTSTFLYLNGSYHNAIDPFSMIMNNNFYYTYIGGKIISPSLLEDTKNNPFALSDVGKTLLMFSGWRFYDGGSVNPSINKSRFYSSNAVFSSSDIGKYIYIDKYGLTVKITEYISQFEVGVFYVFDLLDVALKFSISNESNKGQYEITSYISPSRINFSPSMNVCSGVAYQIIEREYSLDDETINIYVEGEIDITTSMGVFVERIVVK